MATFSGGERLPQPGDCAECNYPKFMHEAGEAKELCTYVPPSDLLRKRRLLLIRAARDSA